MTKLIKIYVAMSGGVDSSVAAYLLKKMGYSITGVFMKNWSDPLAMECPWKNDLKDFHKVCQHLKIPKKIVTFEQEYRNKVVKYLINGYQEGITPNPDMLCNREIKFKLFLNHAKKAGANLIATGHYAINRELKNGQQQLLQAKDKNKDQSYFLALLNQKQLKHSIFPIGPYTKQQVRRIAKEAGIPVYNKKDSQGICFIGNIKFKKFIRQFIKVKPGLIKTTKKKIIGQHDGLSFYTIGQRHGLKIGGGIPYYVAKKNFTNNELIVGIGQKDKSLYNKRLNLANMHWISGRSPKLPLNCHSKIRYRQPKQKCTIYKQNKKIFVEFNKPQRAITPGQFCVLYKRQILLGGGPIN